MQYVSFLQSNTLPGEASINIDPKLSLAKLKKLVEEY